MLARGRGAIINVTSVAGMTSAPAHAYGVAKAGLIHLTASLAAEWGPEERARQRGVARLHPHAGA